MTRRCCGGRLGEIFCRARYCVPFSIIIIAIHFALWWYVIYPRLISSKDLLLENDYKTGYGPGYSDRAYLSDEEGGSGQNYDSSRESTTASVPFEEASSVSSFETTSHEFGVPSSSVENLRQEFGAQVREIQRPPQHRHNQHHQHRHRHNNPRNRYVVRRKKPIWYGFTSTPSPANPTAAQRRILDNVSTRRQPQYQQTPAWSNTWPTQPSWPSSKSTTVNPTTLLTNLVVQVTTTTRHRPPPTQHHQHRQHHGHHQHHTTTTLTPTQAPVVTPQFRHHHHFEKERNEELQRQQEQIEREKERREQERMRLLVEEKSKLKQQQQPEEVETKERLPEDLEQRAQAIYDAQQRSLKQMKEEKLRMKTVQEEEARRREEHERRLQEWNRQDERVQQPEKPHIPPLHESNQWHHPRVENQQQQQRQQAAVNIQHPFQQRPLSSEVVADPWAHLRQVQEQRSTSHTVAPATRSPGISNEIDPFSITRHSLEEASGVWRGHVDHQNTHINSIDHPQHHQHNQHRQHQNQHQQQHHQREQERQRPQPRIEVPQRPSEADARRQMIEDEERRKEEYERRLQQWQRENEARQQLSTTTPSTLAEIPQPGVIHPQQQHHYHSVLGLPHQTHHHGHHHQQHQQPNILENEISNEIAPLSPPMNREKRDSAPVIVTGLLDIGRSEWFQFTRHYSTYLENLMDLLKLQNRFIIFGDQQVLEYLQNHSDLVDFSRIQFVHFGLDDLSFSRYRDEIKGIMDDEQKNWQDSWEKAMKTHPESINPDYNILTNSKPYLLYNATQISKFDSDYYIWLDAGYSHGERNMIPSILWNPVLPPGKMTVIKLTPKQDKVTNYKIEHIYRKNWPVISGGLLAGDKVTIDRFRRYFYKTFMDLLEDRKTDDDQNLILFLLLFGGGVALKGLHCPPNGATTLWRLPSQFSCPPLNNEMKKTPIKTALNVYRLPFFEVKTLAFHCQCFKLNAKKKNGIFNYGPEDYDPPIKIDINETDCLFMVQNRYSPVVRSKMVKKEYLWVTTNSLKWSGLSPLSSSFLYSSVENCFISETNIWRENNNTVSNTPIAGNCSYEQGYCSADNGVLVWNTTIEALCDYKYVTKRHGQFDGTMFISDDALYSLTFSVINNEYSETTTQCGKEFVISQQGDAVIKSEIAVARKKRSPLTPLVTVDEMNAANQAIIIMFEEMIKDSFASLYNQHCSTASTMVQIAMSQSNSDPNQIIRLLLNDSALTAITVAPGILEAKICYFVELQYQPESRCFNKLPVLIDHLHGPEKAFLNPLTGILELEADYVPCTTKGKIYIVEAEDLLCVDQVAHTITKHPLPPEIILTSNISSSIDFMRSEKYRVKKASYPTSYDLFSSSYKQEVKETSISIAKLYDVLAGKSNDATEKKFVNELSKNIGPGYISWDYILNYLGTLITFLTAILPFLPPPAQTAVRCILVLPKVIQGIRYLFNMTRGQQPDPEAPPIPTAPYEDADSQDEDFEEDFSKNVPDPTRNVKSRKARKKRNADWYQGTPAQNINDNGYHNIDAFDPDQEQVLLNHIAIEPIDANQNENYIPPPAQNYGNFEEFRYDDANQLDLINFRPQQVPPNLMPQPFIQQHPPQRQNSNARANLGLVQHSQPPFQSLHQRPPILMPANRASEYSTQNPRNIAAAPPSQIRPPLFSHRSTVQHDPTTRPSAPSRLGQLHQSQPLPGNRATTPFPQSSIYPILNNPTAHLTKTHTNRLLHPGMVPPPVNMRSSSRARATRPLSTINQVETQRTSGLPRQRTLSNSSRRSTSNTTSRPASRTGRGNGPAKNSSQTSNRSQPYQRRGRRDASSGEE